MENDLKYQVRSREIIDLVSAMRSNRLTLTSYFQRNLVWRDTHKRDFIETILKGFPIPQIFLARGPINIDTMAAEQCVVDGQQRLNTILEFTSGNLEVREKRFADFSPREKDLFLKYEVAVIDFDLNAGDDRLKEVFYRLNRTYYSLSAIERIATEYSASEFLLAARVLCGEITSVENDEEIRDYLINDNIDSSEPGQLNIFMFDPEIDDNTWAWLREHANGPYTNLITNGKVFTSYEFDRKVPLMFTLDVMATYLTGYFNRNDRVRKLLEDKNDEFSERDEVIFKINRSAEIISKINLPEDSMWFSKANFFSLICEIVQHEGLLEGHLSEIRERLVEFARAVPADYSLAAREAVGRKNQRELRGAAIKRMILASILESPHD